MIKKNTRPKMIVSLALAAGACLFTVLQFKLFHNTKKPEYSMIYFWIALFGCAMIGVLGACRFELKKKTYTITSIVVFILSMINSMNISILFSDGFLSTIYIYIVNIAFYVFFAAMALMISAGLRSAAVTALAVSYVFNVISFLVYSFRGTSLTPTDIYGFKTAMNVAGEYHFRLKYEMITATIIAAAQIMLAVKFPIKLKVRRQKLVLRLSGLAAAAISAIFIANVNLENYDVSVFDQYFANLNYGSAFSFYANTAKMGMKPNDNYDPEKLNAVLDAYEGDTEIPEERPNIIVIMNESFSDLSVVGDIETNEEYLSWFRSVKNNAVKGELLVSVFGGNTCNSEFEFLTGMSTGLMKANALPYAQMIFDNIPYSLVSHLKAMGYDTTAFHPYYGDGWNRPNVYGFMGFDRFISYENMFDYVDHADRLRAYVSDRGDYDTLLSILEKREDKSKPVFLFNVTMQNHGGYEYKDFESNVKITNMEGEYPQAEQYLSCIQRSDEAIRYLMEELEKSDEPTILLLFGDHQPNVEKEFFEELYGSELEDLDNEALTKRFKVPFMIWANYDIEEKEGVETSPCFLSNELMEIAKLPKSRVQMYLDDIHSEIKQLNPMGYFDYEGKWHLKSDYEGIEQYYDLAYSIIKNKPLHYDFFDAPATQEPESSVEDKQE